jgi:CubicO group peptidase (beta-lactamase class C family)
MEFYEQPQGEAVSHSFFQHYDITDFKSISIDWAGGGLITTTEDLNKFMWALMNNSYFSRPATKQIMLDWVPTVQEGGSYGLGIEKFFVAGEELIGHTGLYNSLVLYWPAQDAVITATINQISPTNSYKSIVQTILIPILNELKK